jgi:hypothetical protein
MPLRDKLESIDCTSETSASAVAEGLSTCFPKPTYVENSTFLRNTKLPSKLDAMKILVRLAQIDLDTPLFFSFLKPIHMPAIWGETVVKIKNNDSVI